MEMLRVHQIAPTVGQACGIGNFALGLAECLKKQGFGVTTDTELWLPPDSDIVLIQYGNSLFDDSELVSFCARANRPVAFLTHFPHVDWVESVVDGFVSLSLGAVSPVEASVLTIPHPARVPDRLEDRVQLRREFGLPAGTVVGTSGFLMFDKELPAILGRLLPVAQRQGWFVDVITSRWREESPGLEDELESLFLQFPGTGRFGTVFLPADTLNRRLQACDLLWCWTRAPSGPYASGAVSDQYASGTQLYVAAKSQHDHVRILRNVVSGPDTRELFVAGLIEHLRQGDFRRHNPAPVGWDRVGPDLAEFLTSLYLARTRG